MIGNLQSIEHKGVRFFKLMYKASSTQSIMRGNLSMIRYLIDSKTLCKDKKWRITLQSMWIA